MRLVDGSEINMEMAEDRNLRRDDVDTFYEFEQELEQR